jgi:hypothetical protein
MYRYIYDEECKQYSSLEWLICLNKVTIHRSWHKAITNRIIVNTPNKDMPQYNPLWIRIVCAL